MFKNFFKKNKDKKEFVFTTKRLGRHTANGILVRQADANNSSTSSYNDNFVALDYLVERVGTPKKSKKEPTKKASNPVDVFKELYSDIPEPSFDDLDNKIKVVEERLSILREHMTDEQLHDEHQALFYLKNRKKYLTTRKKYPIDWAMTNSDACNDLCKRHKLIRVPLKQFYTLLPNDAIKELDRYTKAYKAITGDDPIVELIKKDEKPAGGEKKDRDPIMIANSPLGNTLFVLGAWDDEVEVVDEIIYYGK